MSAGNPKNKESFILHFAQFEAIERLNLSLEDRGHLLNAIFQYAKERTVSDEIPDIVKGAFAAIQVRMDEDEAAYQRKIEILQENGKRGGRPRKYPVEEKQEKAKKANGFSENQMQPNESKKTLSLTVTDTVTDNNIPNGIISSDKQKTSFNFDGLFQFWNKTMQNVAISQMRGVMTEKRKKAVYVILKSYSSKEIAEVIEKAARSSFLNGANERKWTANFDFVFRSEQFTKILEGSYDDDKPNLQGMKSQSERNIEAAQREAIEQTAAIVEASRQDFASPDEAADYLAKLNADTDPNEIFPD